MIRRALYVLSWFVAMAASAALPSSGQISLGDVIGEFKNQTTVLSIGTGTFDSVTVKGWSSSGPFLGGVGDVAITSTPSYPNIWLYRLLVAAPTSYSPLPDRSYSYVTVYNFTDAAQADSWHAQANLVVENAGVQCIAGFATQYTRISFISAGGIATWKSNADTTDAALCFSSSLINGAAVVYNPSNGAISNYYRSGGFVPNTPANAAVPTSGQIKLSDFYGTSR